MVPGLHPALLISGASAKLEFENLPQALHIDTAGGPGTRYLTLAVEVVNGVGPFTYEWAISASGFAPVPSEGSGTADDAYVSFTSQIYHDGGETSFSNVGEAYLSVTDSAGRRGDVRVPVTAGGTGTGGGPPGL